MSSTSALPSASPAPAPARLGSWFKRLGNIDFALNNILLLALILLCAVFAVQSPVFFTWSNAEIILTNNAAIGVLVAAMTLLAIAGHVDLSVGSNIALSSMIAALCMTEWECSAPVAIAAGIGTGALAGAANGVMCALLRFNPIIVTLGMLGILRGATLLISNTEVYGLGDAFNTLGNGAFLGVPVLLWIVVACFAASALFISLTTWGRYIYAIGINAHAAFLAALPVRALPFALYVITGAAAGLAGVMLAARVDGSSPGSMGLQMELQALTIILLGGVAFAGGRGRMTGVIIAWIFLGVLSNGLTLLNVTPFVQLVASGLALVFAAALDTLGTVIAPRLEQRRRALEQQRAQAARA
ncbi:ABC transporter permease [Caldimonas thermodepolymerans]|uniref:ABC transporter permease n=1 Tax=Caldimonas thermodepolymerans TaxID=215580 RepID=UPI002236AB2D|nr:ABC transporter permease [Caldimonas thermodepolymerans]UZG44443.1 ABC transporter permease [Caldimonas thermodepolymerans]